MQFWMMLPGWSLGVFRKVPNEGSREARIALSCLREVMWTFSCTILPSTPSS